MDIACAVDGSAIVYFMNSAEIEVLPHVGILRLIAHSNFYSELLKMFSKREELPVDSVTDGENELGCVNCLIYKKQDRNARPALAKRRETADGKWAFSLPRDNEMKELFLFCPALVKATADGAGYFPCEGKEFMSIVHA